MEEATQLGFPSLRRLRGNRGMVVFYTPACVNKGFDPENQDVARDLNYPMYQLSSELEVTSAYVEDQFSGSEDDEYHPSAAHDGSTHEITESTAEISRVEQIQTPQRNLTAISENAANDLKIGDRKLPELSSLNAGDPLISRSWHMLMAVKFTLILSLTLSSLYHFNAEENIMVRKGVAVPGHSGRVASFCNTHLDFFGSLLELEAWIKILHTSYSMCTNALLATLTSRPNLRSVLGTSESKWRRTGTAPAFASAAKSVGQGTIVQNKLTGMQHVQKSAM
ncbi:hypothetical protein C8R44DRAFT_933005 [Mycena epipterygia]|nr:hypothetical protein C8R44DRAFT_933005 [Mycena epipterygia]